MIGFEGDLHLAELPGDILRRSLQSSARQLGQHLLSGRTGDVYARAGGLPDGRQRLFEGRPLAGVRDVEPRLAVDPFLISAIPRKKQKFPNVRILFSAQTHRLLLRISRS